MAEPCQICGDPGVIEAIITCCECKSAREHLYCMKIFRTQAPPFWRCEECEQKSSVSPLKTVQEHKPKSKTEKISMLMQKTTRVIESPTKNTFAGRFNFKERGVVTGRTKYISCEEAVKISSGSKNTSRNANRYTNGSPEIMPPLLQRTPMKIPQKESVTKFEKQTSVQQVGPKAKSEVLPKCSQEPKKPNAKTGSKNHENVEARSSAGVKPNVTSSLFVTEKHKLYIPVFHSCWKGSFYLPNGHGKFNNAFKAHPPLRVPDKVYETLLKMPENIYFELVPNQVCLQIFSGYSPDNEDIGFYLFPRFKNRLENNISMIDFLWRENLVMKSIVNGVELLVFSSRLLQTHSQEFQGNYFLWGVFRCPKIVKVMADSQPLLEPKHEPCDDVPPGFKKIFRPCGDDVPPGFKKIFMPCGDDVPPGFKKICKR